MMLQTRTDYAEGCPVVRAERLNDLHSSEQLGKLRNRLVMLRNTDELPYDSKKVFHSDRVSHRMFVLDIE
jgi:hypothetical protein